VVSVYSGNSSSTRGEMLFIDVQLEVIILNSFKAFQHPVPIRTINVNCYRIHRVVEVSGIISRTFE
jgi:hypothetical protein